MSFTTPNSYFASGARDAIPFLFVTGPFGLLFGVLATEAGLNLTQTMTFSVSMYAGSAQFTALQLMQEQAPVLIIIISALAVNLRMAMYSASITPYLGSASLWQRASAAYFIGDQSYALSVVKYETDPKMTTSQKLLYFFGTNVVNAPLWYGATLAGAVLGARIPDALALDFVLPLAFLAMTGPMLRTPAHMAAALVAITTALVAAGLPYNLGLIVAGIAGMMAGARVELMTERRRAAA
jgi:predicted branched-subunit amino acid permease